MECGHGLPAEKAPHTPDFFMENAEQADAARTATRPPAHMTRVSARHAEGDLKAPNQQPQTATVFPAIR
jgi:hypothetical protein